MRTESPVAERERRIVLRERATLLGWVVVGIAGFALILSQLMADEREGQLDSQGTAVVVGTPGGEVLATPDPMPASTPVPTASPTLAGTPEPSTPPVAPAATPAPAPPTPVPTNVVAAAPPPAQVAVAPPAAVQPAAAPAQSPADAVATWYGNVESGRFDPAYAQWTERMKANFPREGNLDGRWRNTADVTIEQIYVAEQTPSTAKVQLQFVETKRDGSARRFIGWWDLALVNGTWYLDQPHF